MAHPQLLHALRRHGELAQEQEEPLDRLPLAARGPLRAAPAAGPDPHPERVGEVPVHPRQRQLREPEHALAAVLTGEVHHRRPAVLGELHCGRRLVETVRHGCGTTATRTRPALDHASTADRSSQPSSLKPAGSHAPSGTNSSRVRISSSCKVCR